MLQNTHAKARDKKVWAKHIFGSIFSKIWGQKTLFSVRVQWVDREKDTRSDLVKPFMNQKHRFRYKISFKTPIERRVTRKFGQTNISGPSFSKLRDQKNLGYVY